MATLILLLLGLLILAGSYAGMLIFRGKARGLTLSLLAPIPAAVVGGAFAAFYLLSYATDYRAVAIFVSLIAVGAWAIGFVLCGIIVVSSKRFRTVRSERHA